MKMQEGERKDKLKHVALKDIIFKDRARVELGDIEELKKNIQEVGVIQPITVDEQMNLLAGGRRYTACMQLEFTTIPAIIRHAEDVLDSKEIELFENIHRKDFTWQERCELTRQIDDLYRSKDPEWSGRKTALLLDESKSNVARDIFIAKAMEKIPELKNAKTQDEALKAVKKLQDRAITTELARRQKEAIQTTNPNDGDKTKGIKAALKQADMNYRIGDCFDGMAQMKTNGHVQFIECDPPYGIELGSLKAGRDSGNSTVEGYNEVPTDKYQEFLDKLTKELYRVAGKDCWMVFWFGPTWQHQVLTSLKAAGWLVDDIPAIWAKASGQTQQPEIYLARAYEPFFICRKGQPVLNKPGRKNIFEFPGCATLGPYAKYHPTQRPVELIEEILETFTIGQQVVFVPFLGSGATLRACYNKGILGYGYDLGPEGNPTAYKDKFMLLVEEDSRKLL